MLPGRRLALPFLLLALLLDADASAQEKHRVLVLNSYHVGYAWSDAILDGLREKLDESPQKLDLFVEYMDTKRHEPEEIFKELARLYALKFAQVDLDLVITSDDNALDFALENRSTLFHGAPLVFCGINDYRPEKLEGQGAVTGVVEDADMAATVEVALRLHPDRSKVYVVHDRLVSSMAAVEELRRREAEFANRAELVYLAGLSRTELLERLGSLSDDALVLFTSCFFDGRKYLDVEESCELVTRSTKVPIYTCWEMNLGCGMVGGRMTSGVRQGHTAGELALRVLAGEDADSIPIIEESPNAYVFDHRELARFGIPQSALPAGSVLVNAPPPSLYERHTVLVWAVGAAFLVLSLLLGGLTLSVVFRRRAEEALRANEADLRITLKSIADAVVATGSEGRVRRMNPVACELSGWEREKAVGRAFADVFQLLDGETRRPVESLARLALSDGEPVLPERATLVARDGVERQVAASAAPIRDLDGAVAGAVVVFRDVTAQSALQEQLRQSQKMEAVGQLAGGLAHDFNNLLTGILGNAELLGLRLERDPESSQVAREIVRASTRAADLTRQLLAFSRRGPLRVVPIDVHELLREVASLLTHSIDRRIRLELTLDAEHALVAGDPTELQSAVLNLALNARDAMPDGGELGLATRNVLIDGDSSLACADRLAPGPYLEIAVSDTGVGIPAEIRERIFEPFFTTKEPGHGTGLGLAGVYGCVESHRGLVHVYSAEGAGSSFKVLLPAAQHGTKVAPSSGEDALVTGHGHVLVVDDEEFVRTLAAKALRDLGYTVSVCADATEALAAVREHGHELDLVVLDLIMPAMSGVETFRRLRTLAPDLPVLLTSGFSRRRITELLDEGAAGFLAKPFHVHALSREVASHIRRRPEVATESA